jgi:hypothetical protein
MLPNIQEKFESLTKKRERLLQRLDSISADVLCYKAGPDKWSVVEVVEHLVIAEDDLLTQLTTEAPSPPLDINSRTPEKYQTVIKVMERDIEVDVPHESMEPHGRLTLDDLLNQWNNIREKLPGLLAEIHADNKDDLVYRHPYGGPLDLSETLQFIEVHFDNHMRHIDRILALTKR